MIPRIRVRSMILKMLGLHMRMNSAMAKNVVSKPSIRHPIGIKNAVLFTHFKDSRLPDHKGGHPAVIDVKRKSCTKSKNATADIALVIAAMVLMMTFAIVGINGFQRGGN